MFSYEAHFEYGELDGYVNEQSCLIWSEGNPQIIHEKKNLVE